MFLLQIGGLGCGRKYSICAWQDKYVYTLGVYPKDQNLAWSESEKTLACWLEHWTNLTSPSPHRGELGLGDRLAAYN